MNQPYRRRSPETWIAARDAYLGGLSARVVGTVSDRAARAPSLPVQEVQDVQPVLPLSRAERRRQAAHARKTGPP